MVSLHAAIIHWRSTANFVVPGNVDGVRGR
jgi:hypothetical protein